VRLELDELLGPTARLRPNESREQTARVELDEVPGGEAARKSEGPLPGLAEPRELVPAGPEFLTGQATMASLPERAGPSGSRAAGHQPAAPFARLRQSQFRRDRALTRQDAGVAGPGAGPKRPP
jgi:hypothetical protein